MIDELEGISEGPTEAEANPMPVDETEAPAGSGIVEPPEPTTASSADEVPEAPTEPLIVPAGITLMGTSREADKLALETYNMSALRGFAKANRINVRARITKVDLIGLILIWAYPPLPSSMAPMAARTGQSQPEQVSVRVQRIKDSQFKS